jgi:hypothetical protein
MAWEWSPFLCQLPVVLRNTQGGVVGTPLSLIGPETGILNEPDREYYRLSVAVEAVVPGSLAAAVETGGNRMPALKKGSDTGVVVFPNVDGTPLGALNDMISHGSRVLFLLQAGGYPAEPERAGVWYAIRFVSLDADGVAFAGACAQELDTQLVEVGAAIGRSPDEGLIVDFHAEVLGNYEDITAKGPIESAAYDNSAATAPPVEPVAPPPSTTADSEE